MRYSPVLSLRIRRIHTANCALATRYWQRATSVASRLKSGVELLEVNAGVFRGELPVDVCVGGVSRNLPGPHFPTKGGWIHDPAAEALNSQDAELDLGYVQPASVLRRVVNLEFLCN